MTFDNFRREQIEQTFGHISPFETKNELIRLASSRDKKSTKVLLNAGRGNPNWTAATAREAFFCLGQFAVQECRRSWDKGDLAGQPHLDGIYERLTHYLQKHTNVPGLPLLRNIIDYGVDALGFDRDKWVFELVDGIVGDNYPVPDRMLIHIEQIVHAYLLQEMCRGKVQGGKFDLFATEGATAAMCYVFDSLSENHLLTRGDKIAIMVPIFPPYFEIPHLAKYDFDVVYIRASEDNGWQYPESELNKLSDETIKALFLINPSNPPSVSMDEDTRGFLIDLVHSKRPDLMIITDDVYGTFVDDYRSLLADLPAQTIGVYSMSKYFGVTGWRLGVVAIHEDNIFDKQLEQLSKDHSEELKRRYASLSTHPEEIKFIDRMVADSRQIALKHTAGLSTPQQVQMAIFAGFALLDTNGSYKQLTKDICRRRKKLFLDSVGVSDPSTPYDASYYIDFDLLAWVERNYDRDFVRYLKETQKPLDVLFSLAEESSIVLLNGWGFEGPEWTLRISVANLDDEAYPQIGEALRSVIKNYSQAWQAGAPPSTEKPPDVPVQ